MSSISASTDMTQCKPEELTKFIDLFCQDVVDTVNGKLDFTTNFNCKLLSITFGSADTDTGIAHGLGRVPAGYIVTGASAATSVYNGSVSSSSTSLVLRASVAATVGLIVF